MFRRTLVAAAVATFVTMPSIARAQDRAAGAPIELSSITTLAMAPTALSNEQLRVPPVYAPPMFRKIGPSPLMASLYASTALMQALDVHSTLTAFKGGATEANPLMGGLTKNRAAFFAVKAGVAASTILAAKQMSKKNKLAAAATLVAINSAYAVVVSHNYRVARGQ